MTEGLELVGFGMRQAWLNPAALSWGSCYHLLLGRVCPSGSCQRAWETDPRGQEGRGLEGGSAQAWDAFVGLEPLAVSCVVSSLCTGTGWGVGVCVCLLDILV